MVLNVRARMAILTRRIPARVPDSIRGVPGSGAACVVCGGQIAGPLEIEIQFTRVGDASKRDTYHAHPRCFEAWEAEWQEIRGKVLLRAPSTTVGAMQDLPVTTDRACVGCASARIERVGVEHAVNRGPIRALYRCEECEALFIFVRPRPG